MAPNALLFAALLLAPRRWWWLFVAAAFPAHLLAELQGSVPVSMVLCWFVSNVTEALIGASFVRWLAGPAPGLSRVRTVIVFCAGAALAALLSSFLDAGFVRLVGFGKSDYWSLVQARAPANMLATLIFVPVAMAWSALDAGAGAPRKPRPHGGARRLARGLVHCQHRGLRHRRQLCRIDGAALPADAVLDLGRAAFRPAADQRVVHGGGLLVIWGAGHGRGPFLHAITQLDALPIQLFLITIGVPLLLLAAVIEERRAAERKLRASQELFSTAFKSSPDAIAISRRSDGHIIEANDHWLALMGYRRDDLRGRRRAAEYPSER